MSGVGKSLIIIGVFIILIGLGFIGVSRFKIPFLGRLPGDILVQKKNFTFYFPLVTSLILSFIFSFILYIISKIHR
ncbi:MAG: DUF2905 domain-containing protein [Candidatus Omnitrophota bacterium]|nr:DUF2905 domain-containing protein [Candidatus Omnitrophota bacterium]